MRTQLAVFGNPIEHSLSPMIHERFASLTGIELDYRKIRAEGSFALCAREFFAAGGAGCNITVPCKKDAYDFADILTERASEAGVVNTLKKCVKEDGSVFFLGDNTDGFGFFSDLKRQGFVTSDKDVLIIGAGGAVNGILLPLLSGEAAVKSITLVNRTTERVEKLIAYFADRRLNCCSFGDLKERAFSLVINATPLPLKGELPPVPDNVFERAEAVYDLCYTAKGATVFTEKAANCGVGQISDGLGMLVGQAALSFELWFGVRPEITPVISYMREILASRS